jgi:rhamnogalacturonyl hydrolase YesR
LVGVSIMPMIMRWAESTQPPLTIMVIFAWSAWCWCDAVFMAPASWMAASRITGDRRYREYAHAEYWATKAYLFDPDEHLFFSR